jgi:hypothetical protein
MLVDEHPNLTGHEWLSQAEVQSLPDRVEPPELASVIRALAPSAPWHSP